MKQDDQIVIYKTEDGQTAIDVKIQDETIWLSQKQMAELFDKNVMTINEHIKNVFSEGELSEVPTIRKSLIVQKEGTRNVEREVLHYNLDVVISVGYRVKSKRGTQFRIWANNVLREYLVRGYALNEKKLKESLQKLEALQQSIQLLSKVVDHSKLNSEEATGLLKVITEYSYALDILDQYDHQRLQITPTIGQTVIKLTYDEAIEQIKTWRIKQNAGPLFGNEKDNSFKGSIETIYQTFDGYDLYPSVEEKAANLLYFVVKNHSFSDGNKRIAAGLFVYFLDINSMLYINDGIKLIADNALVAITIMIAESKPDEKDIMIKLLVNLMRGSD